MITNHSQMNKEKFVKFNKDMLRLRSLSNSWLGITGISLGVIFIICGIFLPNMFVIGLSLGVFMILLFTLLLCFPKIVEKNAGKVFDANAKGNPTQEFEFIFDEEELMVKNSGGRILAEGEYNNIEQVVETPDSFYLVVDVNSCFGFIVDKNGFIEGDATKLAEVLKAKIEKYVEIEK